MGAAIGSYERVDGTIDLHALFDKALDAFVLETETEKEAGTPAGSRRGAPPAACTPETPGAPGEGVAAGTQPVTPPATLEVTQPSKMTVDGNFKQHNRATPKNSLTLPENYPSPPGNERVPRDENLIACWYCGARPRAPTPKQPKPYV